MKAGLVFERKFVAYGVRITVCTDCRGLVDTLEQDPNGLLPWRSVEVHEPDAPVSIHYEVRTGSDGARPAFRVYAGPDLIAELHHVSDVSWALAAHAEPFVAERAPDHLFVHAGDGEFASPLYLSAVSKQRLMPVRIRT